MSLNRNNRIRSKWYMEYFDVPRCQITKRLGIAKSALYRWLKEFDSIIKDKREPVNKTPNELARLVWSIHKSNPDWGRHRISLQIALLGVFLSASTVRNILSRPYPPTNKKSNSEKTNEKQEETNLIRAKHPNHVWSIDRTIVKRWGIWNTYVLVGIDHYSRKIVCCAPLEGPNAGWTIDVFESSI